jgi:hypothetical protein
MAERYIKFDPAGDQHIGRILSGLPQQSTDFALLPLMFSQIDTVNEDFLNACRVVVGSTNLEGLRRAHPYLFASLLEHEAWILSNIDRRHPYFHSSYFQLTQTDRDRLTVMIHQRTKLSLGNHNSR